MPTTFNVSDETSLNGDIRTIDAAPAGAYQLDFAGSIPETMPLEAINLPSGVTLTIDGAGFALYGAGQQRGLFVYAGAVTVEDLTIQNAVAVGGAGGGGAVGGGGGAGLGGGLFVGSNVAGDPGQVTLLDVAFNGDKATGGAGGAGGESGTGGGGGMGGAGGGGAGGGGGGLGGAGRRRR